MKLDLALSSDLEKDDWFSGVGWLKGFKISVIRFLKTDQLCTSFKLTLYTLVVTELKFKVKVKISLLVTANKLISYW